MMKATVVFSTLLIILISCQNESVAPVKGDKPLHITYTSSTSGELQGEEFYEYNDKGLVSKYKYNDLIGNTLLAWNREVEYDYNSGGALIEKREKFGVNSQFAKTEYIYNNGLKVLETYYSVDGNRLAEKKFFYSDLRLLDRSVYDEQVETFTYDNNNHLVRKVTKYMGDVIQDSNYTYDGNLLVKSCENRCLIKSYNENGQLIQESAEYDGGVTIKSAEYFYKDGLLDEKWSYQYATAGDASSNFDIVKAKYEY